MTTAASTNPTLLVGALLRRPFQELRKRIHDDLVASGFEDIHPAHLNVFQHPAPGASRPTDLARSAGMTKQAMNHLLRQLEALGYIERRESTGDRRATTLWLTPRGEAAVRRIRRTVLTVEDEWSSRLGEARYRELRVLLSDLNGAFDRPDTDRRESIAPASAHRRRALSEPPTRATLAPRSGTAPARASTAPPRSGAPPRASTPPRSTTTPTRRSRG